MNEVQCNFRLFGLLLWCEVFQELQMAFFACADSVLFSPKVLQKLWSDHSPVLSIEQLLVCKSPSRLSQVANFLNRILYCINENTPETWGKDVKFKVKKWAKWSMDLDDFQKCQTKNPRVTVPFSSIPLSKKNRVQDGTSLQKALQQEDTDE